MTSPSTAGVSSHRQWPVPSRGWSMRMVWHDLCFLHWPVDAGELRKTLPSGLELDLYEDQAWVGVVPFRMSGVSARWLPNLPRVSAFPELNVRTYVVCDNKPGVWFHSLDATNPLAVRTARWTYNLRYMDAKIDFRDDGDWIHYASQRVHRDEPSADLECRYRPVGDAITTEAGSLEHWLTARYCLCAASRKGRIFRGEVDHPPWEIREGEADITQNTMTDSIDVQLPDAKPLVHFARRTDVRAWSLDPV